MTCDRRDLSICLCLRRQRVVLLNFDEEVNDEDMNEIM